MRFEGGKKETLTHLRHLMNIFTLFHYSCILLLSLSLSLSISVYYVIYNGTSIKIFPFWSRIHSDLRKNQKKGIKKEKTLLFLVREFCSIVHR